MKYDSGSCIQNLLPEKANYFKEEIISEILSIPPQKPSLERVLDILVWPEIENIKIIETSMGLSNEGQYLSGIKLIVEIKLREKLTYVGNEGCNSIYAINYETIKSLFIILPEEINGISTVNLVNSNRINVIPYIEDINFRRLDCRNVFRNIMLFVNANVC